MHFGGPTFLSRPSELCIPSLSSDKVAYTLIDHAIEKVTSATTLTVANIEGTAVAMLAMADRSDQVVLWRFRGPVVARTVPRPS